jgi:hypothetical protein
MRFVMNHLAGLKGICELPAFAQSELDLEMSQAILEEVKYVKRFLIPLIGLLTVHQVFYRVMKS